MQKWEYLILETWEGRPFATNGKELLNWKEIDLYDYINQLGDQGWELVAAPLAFSEVGASVERFSLIFKRSKQ